MLCGYLQLEHLSRAGIIRMRAKPYWKVSSKDFDCDCIFVCRTVSFLVRYILQRGAKCGCKILFSIDDDLMNVPPDIPSFFILSSKPHFERNLVEEISVADVLVSPSKALLEQYGGRFGISERLFLEEPVSYSAQFEKHETLPIKICFAASQDRAGDFDSILGDAVLKLKERFGDLVDICFVGNRPQIAEKIECRSIPKMDYDDYWQYISREKFDIGLAPMPDSSFHSYKHYNKFMEYARAGICGVFSNVMPYTQIKQFFPSVLLVDNTTDSWFSCLVWLIEHREEIEKHRWSSLQYVKENLSIDKIADTMIPILQCKEKNNVFGLYDKLRFGFGRFVRLVLDFFCVVISKIRRSRVFN